MNALARPFELCTERLTIHTPRVIKEKQQKTRRASALNGLDHLHNACVHGIIIIVANCWRRHLYIGVRVCVYALQTSGAHALAPVHLMPHTHRDTSRTVSCASRKSQPCAQTEWVHAIIVGATRQVQLERTSAHRFAIALARAHQQHSTLNTTLRVCVCASSAPQCSRNCVVMRMCVCMCGGAGAMCDPNTSLSSSLRCVASDVRCGVRPQRLG